MTATESDRAASRIARASLGLSVVLVVPLVWVWLRSSSLIGLAQAADSAADAIAAGALLYSLQVAARPPDEDYPRGHRRAEPIAALVASVLIGVLALEVLRDAILAIIGAAEPTLSPALAMVLGVKVLAKLALTLVARSAAGDATAPALHVIEVDARNDVLVGTLSLLGVAVVHFGTPRLDAWLALPIGLWIGAAGLELARENVALLMGVAAPADRQRELHGVAAKVTGVRSVHDLVARREGTALDVTAHVVVDPELTVRQAHDIAVAARNALLAETDVGHAMIHVDVEGPDQAASSHE